MAGKRNRFLQRMCIPKGSGNFHKLLKTHFPYPPLSPPSSYKLGCSVRHGVFWPTVPCYYGWTSLVKNSHVKFSQHTPIQSLTLVSNFFTNPKPRQALLKGLLKFTNHKMSLWVRQRKERSERASRNWEQIYFGLCHGLSVGLGQLILLLLCVSNCTAWVMLLNSMCL